MSFEWIPRARRGSKMRRALKATQKRNRHVHRVTTLELLDVRLLLDTGVAHPDLVIYQGPSGIGPYQSSAPQGYTPAQVRKAYGIDSISINGIVGDGSGQTIALVDAYDWPTAAQDLHNFDLQFGLPDPPSFTKVNQLGQSSPLPGTDPAGAGNPKGTWEGEEALDVEWAHAIAPMANIILVEANSASTADLIDTAVATAKTLPGVSTVSMSFGGPEQNGFDQTENNLFTTPAGHTGVTFLASTGDTGSPGGFPAYSPNVVAVGGTSLFLNSNNSYQSESGWSGSGGGVSTFEPKPAYQSALPYNFRSIPDVAFLADPNTGVAVYDSWDNGSSTPWVQVGGTSLASPSWAGLIAIVNQERVAAGDPVLDGPTQTLPLLYSLPASDFHDITTGSNGGFSAGPGYDLVTGLGTPVAPSLVADLTPLPLKVSPVAVVNAQEGIALSNIQIATFTYSGGLQATSAYTATINWGDNTSLGSGTVIDLKNGSYGINATHTFAEEGTYTITINVSGPDGVVGEASEQVVVSDAPLTALNGFVVNTTEGQAFNGLVGSFLDGNIFAPTTDFTAQITWGNGANTTGTVRADGTTKGQFDIFGTNTYIAAGKYNISITVNDVGGSQTTITGVAVVADAPLTSVGQSLTTTEGAPFSGTLSTVTDGNTFAVASDYTATIDWGDGTSSSPDITTGTVSAVGNGVFTVSGTHTYKEFGTYTVTVNVTDFGGSTTSSQSTATVADAALLPNGATLTSTAGQPIAPSGSPDPVVGRFTDGNPFGTLADFSSTVTVDWGDGSTSTGQVSALAGAVFAIAANHNYHRAGTYQIKIPITDDGGSTTSVVSTITVADAPITPGKTSVSGLEGHDVTPSGQTGALVATFTDSNPFALLTDMSAVIDWGDGTTTQPDTTAGQITQAGGVGTAFSVLGSHVYAFAGKYSVSVTITSAGGSTATTTSTATIADAPITGTAATLPSLVEGTAFNGQIATFTDGNPLGQTSDFIVPVTWGDGNSSVATLTALGNGVFSVSSSNLYTQPGTYPFSVKVIDIGGSTLTMTGSVTVLDAPIVPVDGSSFSQTEGTTFSGQVATFNDAPTSPASDFTAQITWGNGATSVGQVVSLGSGLFGVDGSQLYEEAGSYPVSVLIHDQTGASATANVTAKILDAALSATANGFTTIRGQALPHIVGQFTDANAFSSAADFSAAINWGNGTTSVGQVVALGGGNFQVIGTNAYSSSGTDTVSLAIKDAGGSTASAQGTVTVISPLVGGATSSLITNQAAPTFSGTGQPNTTVQLVAIPLSNPATQIALGSATVSSTGTWTVGGTALSDNKYAIVAIMSTASGQPLQAVNLTPASPLIVDRTGPTVTSAQFLPAQSRLVLTLHDSLSGLNPATLLNSANLSFQAVGQGLRNVAVTGITLQPGAAGSGDVIETVSLALGRRLSNNYVLTLNATGIADNAGNTLVEKTFVTFPQTTNYPNPNYVAEFTVFGGQSSGPEQYISAAERRAAARYVGLSRLSTRAVRFRR